MNKENEELKNQVDQLKKRPTFYYDNNRNTYVWCCRCSDSNMSLHMFLENGEIQQYASENYDKWCEKLKEVKEIDVCEFMHKFVKPLIQEKNDLENKVKEQKTEIEKKDKMTDLILEELWQEHYLSYMQQYDIKNKGDLKQYFERKVKEC